MSNLLRERIKGVPDTHDRLWRLISPQGVVEAVTDYNWGVTGSTDGLREHFHYSANAYYWLDEYRKRGWKIERIDDRERGDLQK